MSIFTSWAARYRRARELRALRERLVQYQFADEVLGARNSRLLFHFGRVMSGPHGGQYVSGIPTAAARALIDALLSGQQIPVHLMHRHRSGDYESSRLRSDGRRLWMLFDDRTELA